MRRELTPRDEAKRLSTPPLQGRGKGWGVDAERLDQLHGFAREMRRQPTEPEKRLWRRLSNSQLGGFKFRRQAVIGPFIADFLCPAKALIVEVDGWTHEDAQKDARRDAALRSLGFAVLRFTNTDVMENPEGVLTRILETLQHRPDRWETPHPNPSPQGEGRNAVEAQKLLGISLEGSVG
jgi:very-short-patch-repair endonuclease